MSFLHSWERKEGGNKEVIAPLFIASGQITCKILSSIRDTSKDVNKLEGFQRREGGMMKALGGLIWGEKIERVKYVYSGAKCWLEDGPEGCQNSQRIFGEEMGFKRTIMGPG